MCFLDRLHFDWLKNDILNMNDDVKTAANAMNVRSPVFSVSFFLSFFLSMYL